jgi:hypothetical protein
MTGRASVTSVCSASRLDQRIRPSANAYAVMSQLLLSTNTESPVIVN